MSQRGTIKEKKRVARHARIRRKISGTPERPRLCVHRSLKHFYAQIIDDTQGKVLMGLSTLNKDVKGEMSNCGNIKGARQLGEAVARIAKDKGIRQVCFDRGGYLYLGRIKAFVEAARGQGLEF